MAHNSNQPRANDVVLGGQTPTPLNGLVLGGLAGVKRRLVSPVVAQRVAAVSEALKYGHSGQELLFDALKDESLQVRHAAYLLLQDYEEPKLKQALLDYNPYQLFKCLYRHSTRHCTAYSVAISPDGQLLVSGGSDRIITVRSLRTGRVLRTLSGHSGSVFTVAISPDGEVGTPSPPLLVSGGGDNTIKVWNLNTGGNNGGIVPQSSILSDGLLYSLTGHSNSVNCVAISSDGQLLVSGSEDSTINLWNFTTEEQVSPSPRITLTGHSQGVKSIAISWDGQTLVSGSADKTIKVWDLGTGELKLTLEGHANWVRSVAISPDGQILASGGQEKIIYLWHLRSGELLRTLEWHWDEVNSLAFSMDGHTLVSGSRDKTVSLWHVSTGVLLHNLEGHEDSVASVAISPDGQTIVSSSWDNTIRVWGSRTK